MKRFSFKLQTVLKLKERAEEVIKTDLGKIQKEISILESKVEESQLDIEKAYKEQEEILKSPTSATLSQFFPYYISSKREQISNYEKLILGQKKQYQVKLQELVQAKAEVDLFTKMRNKKETEYNKFQTKKAQNDIDDILIARRAQKEEV